MSKTGRPTKYEGKETCEKVRRLIEEGIFSEAAIARTLGIGKATLWDWKHRYKEFAGVLTALDWQTAEEIRAAHVKRAKGYTITKTIKKAIGKDKKSGQPILATVQKETIHVPGSVTAQKSILKQLAGWEDKQTSETAIDMNMRQQVAADMLVKWMVQPEDYLTELKTNLSNKWWRLNNLYYVINEEGQKVLFVPNEEQEKLFDDLWYLNIILKARQLGFTTFIDIYFLDEVLFNSNVEASIIAHNKEDATKIFRRKVCFHTQPPHG